MRPKYKRINRTFPFQLKSKIYTRNIISQQITTKNTFSSLPNMMKFKFKVFFFFFRFWQIRVTRILHSSINTEYSLFLCAVAVVNECGQMMLDKGQSQIYNLNSQFWICYFVLFFIRISYVLFLTRYNKKINMYLERNHK